MWIYIITVLFMPKPGIQLPPHGVGGKFFWTSPPGSAPWGGSKKLPPQGLPHGGEVIPQKFSRLRRAVGKINVILLAWDSGHTFLKSSHMSSVSSLSSHVILVSSHGMTCHPHVIRAGMTCHPSPQHEGDNLSSPTGAHSSVLSLVCPILAAAGC